MAELSEAELALLETVRHGLNEAAVMVDVATYQGDKPPYSSGYDDVHDAANAIWAAGRALAKLTAALQSGGK